MFGSNSDLFQEIFPSTWLYNVELGKSIVIEKVNNSYWWYLHIDRKLKAQGVSNSYKNATKISVYESKGLK